MRKSWPIVKIGEVLIERREVPDAESMALGTIQIVSKISFGLGKVELRQEVGTKTGMILVRPGDLLLSGINAAKGAIAIYGRDNTEPVAATIHYGAYNVVQDRADIYYMWWYLRSRPFREILSQSLPEGIKTELKAKRLLPIEIPLPPISEQRRIVARIEELVAQIAEARSLRQQAVEEAEALTHSFLSQLLHTDESRVSRTFQSLSAIAEINPSCGNRQLTADSQVSFVPMRAVSDETGTIVAAETRSYSDVQKGYTRFENGDIIFARITPCMQNGKSAIAVNLVNDVGFGSTEFHVIRPGPEIDARWIHHLVRHREFIRDASEHFTGTAGQQRVPATFMKEKKVFVPPLPEQRRIVEYLDGLQAEVDVLKRLQSETAAELDALLPSILDRAFKEEL